MILNHGLIKMYFLMFYNTISRNLSPYSRLKIFLTQLNINLFTFQNQTKFYFNIYLSTRAREPTRVMNLFTLATCALQCFHRRVAVHQRLRALYKN